MGQDRESAKERVRESGRERRSLKTVAEINGNKVIEDSILVSARGEGAAAIGLQNIVVDPSVFVKDSRIP